MSTNHMSRLACAVVASLCAGAAAAASECTDTDKMNCDLMGAVLNPTTCLCEFAPISEPTAVDYPTYGADVAKPWEENADFWFEYFKDRVDLYCYSATIMPAECAASRAEYVRMGICHTRTISADSPEMKSWLDEKADFELFLKSNNVEEPSGDFWTCG